MTISATSPAPRKTALDQAFDSFSDHWAPRLAARYNGNEVRLAKVASINQIAISLEPMRWK